MVLPVIAVLCLLENQNKGIGQNVLSEVKVTEGTCKARYTKLEGK